MARRHRIIKPHYLLNSGLSLVVLVLFGATGAKVLGSSSAASANPYGFADYCALENNTTVIYGWAADPDASSLSDPSVTINAGGQAVTVPTNRAGYRDGYVNSWIDQNRTGDPKPGTYGYRAALPGLYKGSRNIITGTVLNAGNGSSVVLTINNSSYTDGDANKPFFANDTIPDACLANVPTTPAPTAAPTATPTPTQAKPTQTTTPTAQQSATTNNGDTDAVVTVGTLAASVAAKADGATSLHINYGTSPIKLDQTTPDQPVSATDPTTVALTGLNPSIDYNYQVVRTYTGGKTTTSSIQSFTTLGYVVAAHFVDSHTKGIQGIKSTLNDGKAIKTSDDNGTVQFSDVPEGTQTIYYAYKNKQYSQRVTVSPDIVSPDQASASHVITLDFTINIEKAADLSAVPSSKNSNSTAIMIGIAVALAALLVVGVIFIRRRKRTSEEEQYENLPTASYQPVPPAHAAAPVVPAPTASRPGESLKEMVLRTMAEEARRKSGNGQSGPDKPF